MYYEYSFYTIFVNKSNYFNFEFHLLTIISIL